MGLEGVGGHDFKSPGAQGGEKGAGVYLVLTRCQAYPCLLQRYAYCLLNKSDDDYDDNGAGVGLVMMTSV